ncbi:MAG: hypothetical protein IBX61_09245 [Thermoleophilia bacterium]|nr:hypothetical protein [Thermoleophilia bacterium]
MMTEEFHDFDAAWEEHEAKPLKFKALGRKWEIPSPSDGSAKFMAELMRLGEVENASEIEQLAILKNFIPEKTLNEMIDAGLTVRQYGDVIRWVVSQMQLQGDDSEDPQKAPREGAAATS